MESIAGKKNPTTTRQKLIVTTSWDDGSVSDLRISDLLNKYSIRSTFYVTKSYRFLERPLTEDEIATISKKHEVGAHTLTHPNLRKISTESAKAEIEGSKRYLEDLLGHSVDMFSYPRGLYDDRIALLVKRAGFIGARTCIPGNLGFSQNLYEFHTNMYASNSSIRANFRIWRLNHLSLGSFADWETRAKELFDRALSEGAVYHLWGHSSEIASHSDWDRLERVLAYISRRDQVVYASNGECCRKFFK